MGALQNDLLKLERSPRDQLRWQKAQQHLTSGAPELAFPVYLDLVKKFPGVVNLWFEYGIAAAGKLDFTAATRIFRRARELEPRNPTLLIAMGQQFHRMRQADAARACFQEAAQADPESAHAALSYAAWLERERRLEEAWTVTDETLRKNPNDDAAKYYRAFLLHRLGKTEEAVAGARDLLAKEVRDPNIRISALHLLASILDLMGDYAGAMVSLDEAKKLARKTVNADSLEQTYDRSVAQRRQLLAALTTEVVSRWRAENNMRPISQRLVLLGGHPRSGTTLLEQILGSHPAMAAVDESEAFACEIWDRLAPAHAPQALTLNALNGLSNARRAEMTARYFKSFLREFPEGVTQEVLIDKNPAVTAGLHLWLRFFSAGKVIIVLRDPRDVILSCYFQNLTLTPMNVNFLSLERAATFYADLMDVWLRLRDLGGFEWIETRYEDFAVNLAGEGRRITEFLGLEWHPNQERFYESAARKLVFSPTYNEVTKPAHGNAIGRWGNYKDAMKPLETRLRGYLEKFGYERNSTESQKPVVTDTVQG